ncbi:MAG: UDP-N-acetylmuramoyl-L-alanine--D-glutamate ligase [Clostridiales bacterium]|nr:UDP-N-acetylmuramoyl-L-alanine--D-glutamate ligase [Clostridiales bacterium]
MNLKLEGFKKDIKGKRAAVIGVGISNRPLISWLYKLGAEVTAFDRLSEDDPSILKAKEDFKDQGVELNWSLGEGYLKALKDREFDYVFKTPKMRYETEELQAAKMKGAVLTTEMELFMDLCPCKIFAVTGSDGKTTTTTVISEILKQGGYKVFLGGNIGTPLLDRVEEIEDKDMVVLELSSFQLLGMRKSADVAVVTNITPNHLDFHKDYDEYIDSKKNIFLYQAPFNKVVLNSACDITLNMRDEARGQVCFFSQEKKDMGPLYEYAYLEDGDLIYEKKDQKIHIVNEKEIFIPGKHNVENFLSAISATIDFVKPEDIAYVARNFKGVPHRIEFVRELEGVRYYNSSIDTSPNRTMNTMNALRDRNEKGVLICGGADKKCIYDGLGDAILNVCDRIVIYGTNAPFVKDILQKEAKDREYTLIEIGEGTSDVYEFPETRDAVVGCMKEALLKAREMARPGELVIMSNIGTSYDHFRHFEHRGDLFKDLVKELK